MTTYDQPSARYSRTKTQSKLHIVTMSMFQDVVCSALISRFCEFTACSLRSRFSAPWLAHCHSLPVAPGSLPTLYHCGNDGRLCFKLCIEPERRALITSGSQHVAATSSFNSRSSCHSESPQAEDSGRRRTWCTAARSRPPSRRCHMVPWSR